MIESFAPFSRGLDVNTKVPGDFTLTDIFGKASGTQGEIELAIFLGCDSAESFGCVTCFRHGRLNSERDGLIGQLPGDLRLRGDYRLESRRDTEDTDGLGFCQRP